MPFLFLSQRFDENNSSIHSFLQKYPLINEKNQSKLNGKGFISGKIQLIPRLASDMKFPVCIDGFQPIKFL